MKKITLVLTLCTLFLVSAFGQERLKDSEINQSKLTIAKEFAKKYLSTLNKEGTYEFKDEAIEALKNLLTSEAQNQMKKHLKSQFGNYVAHDFAEVWGMNGTQPQIFRFKVDFVDSVKKVEARVVVDDNDKIAGFWIKPWSDVLH